MLNLRWFSQPRRWISTRLTEQANALSEQITREAARNEVGSKAKFAKLGEELKTTERNLSTYRDELRDGTHSHPYYWAPFILVGDGR